MVRNVLSVVLAFVIGGLAVFAVEKLGHTVYPIPAGLDPNNLEGLAEYVKTMPVGALLFVLAAQSAGSLIGGLVTGFVSVAKFPTAMIYGVLALIMAALNAFAIPHPIWFTIVSLVLPIPLALLGSRIGRTLWVKT
ncbi:MAG TPA: hypothetical protein PKM58_04590 [Pyrinomonadaceae bacterium]|nr:hypothetical protein [Pyrinomonadaceae bacterium]